MLANHVYFLRESIFETMERNDVFQSRAVKSVEKNVEDTSQSNLAISVFQYSSHPVN